MLRKFYLFCLFIGIFISISSACLAKDSGNIKVFHLKNGQTVVIQEEHANPIVTIDTWVRTGSINENDKNNGVSHFLEHLIFKGTKKYKAGEVDKILESKGANYNAATSKDFTHFYITTSSKFVNTALDLHSDMLINATVPQDELDRERKVVQEEIRRSMDDPGSILFKNLNSELFKHHPYRYDTLGTIEIIGSIPREEILKYYHKWYVPSNMITVVVGDVNTQKILKLVEQDFNGSNKCKISQPVYAREPELTKPALKVEKGKFNTGYMQVGYKGVPITDKKENMALDIAASILGDGRSSRLYQALKEKKNIVSSISAGHYSMKDDSIVFVEANYEPDNFTAVKDGIISEIDKLKAGGVTPVELKRAKTQAQRNFLYNSESVEDIANSIGYCMTISGKLSCYTNYVADLNKITANDVQNAARKYLQDSRVTISALLPEKTEIKVSAKSSGGSFKNVTKSVLDNGMVLITDKNTSNEIISLSIFVKGGDLVEPIPGISDVIAGTLMKGTQDKTALEISNELENSGIIISPVSNSDYFEIQLKSTASDFDKAFRILADVIKNPAFKQEYIDKAKSDIIQSVRETRDTPLSYAFDKFSETLFPNHPYGYGGDVLEKSVPTIKRDDILKYYKDVFIPGNMIVSVSGNVDPNDFAEKFSSAFPSVNGKIIDVDSLKTPFKPLSQQLITSVYEDTAAAWMLIGWPVQGITQEKDYASLKVINAILGDGLSSRLFVSLREKQGLAYAVSSAYPSRLDNSFFVLYIGTEPKNVEIAKNGFLSEINKIKDGNIDEKELNEAKQKIVGKYALSQETNQQKAHNLGWFEAIGKGYKFDFTYPDLINSVTTDDIIRTANKYFNSPYAISIVAPENCIKVLEKDNYSESKR